MDYLIYKYIHLTGLVFWMGGLFSLSSFIRYIAKQEDSEREKLAHYTYKIYYSSNFIGLLLVIGSGVLLIMTTADVMKSGWFHSKLLFVVILLALDHLILRKIKALTKSKSEIGLIQFMHILTTVLFLGILSLVIFKPF